MEGTATLKRAAPRRRSLQRGRVRHEVEAMPAEVERLDRLAKLMDSQFSFLGIRFGLDSILGLVPVAGDVASLGMSSYLLFEAARAGARKRTLAKMGVNVAVDTIIGSIPILGDAFDVVFKANRRNARIVREELLRKHEQERSRDSRTITL